MPPKSAPKKAKSAPKKAKKAPPVIDLGDGLVMDGRIIDRLNDPNYREPPFPRDNTGDGLEEYSFQSLSPFYLQMPSGQADAPDLLDVPLADRGDLFSGDVFPANPFEEMRQGRQSNLMRMREREASPESDLDLSLFDK